MECTPISTRLLCGSKRPQLGDIVFNQGRGYSLRNIEWQAGTVVPLFA